MPEKSQRLNGKLHVTWNEIVQREGIMQCRVHAVWFYLLQNVFLIWGVFLISISVCNLAHFPKTEGPNSSLALAHITDQRENELISLLNHRGTESVKSVEMCPDLWLDKHRKSLVWRKTEATVYVHIETVCTHTGYVHLKKEIYRRGRHSK